MKTSNQSFNSLSNLGRSNTRNRVDFGTAVTSSRVGVAVSRPSTKKATRMELLIPVRRSGRGSRRTLAIALNGAQARDIYETLSQFYGR